MTCLFNFFYNIGAFYILLCYNKFIMEKKKTLKWKVWGSIFFVLVLVGLAFFLFSGDNFLVLQEMFKADADPDKIKYAISKLGIRAYIVIGILAMLQVLFTFIPAEPLHVVAGMSFGLWKGMLVCFIGILIGNTLIFLLNKLFGTKLKDYFATNVEFDFDAASTSNKLALIVIILYCLPAIPYGIICFFAASMGMRYSKYILITGVGSIPSLFLDVGLGHVTMSISWIISVSIFLVIIVLLIIMFKYKAKIFEKVNAYVRKTKEKEKNRVGKYNPFIYNVCGRALLWWMSKKIKIKTKNNVEKLERPSIILCNHGSFYDFVFLNKMLFKERIHFVAARLYFNHKIVEKLLSGTGAFPKSMFTNDITSVKNCLKVIKNGEILAMMPEARLSTVGNFEDVQPTTYSFLQKMNVTVYVLNINGSYLANPKWGNGLRKGAVVEAELTELFKAGELKDLTLDQIKEKVETAIDYNEWDWLKSRPEIHYKNKDLAEGIENVLAICPHCKAKYSLSTNKKVITCEKCGLSVTMDDRYQLSGVEFKNIAEWYDWQIKQIADEINADPNFRLESKVELRHLSHCKEPFTRHAGHGVCTLSREGLRYVGTEDGKEIDKFFPIDNIYRLLFGAGEDFEIYEDQELYYFVPENKKSCVTWYVVSKILKE